MCLCAACFNVACVPVKVKLAALPVNLGADTVPLGVIEVSDKTNSTPVPVKLLEAVHTGEASSEEALITGAAEVSSNVNNSPLTLAL